MVHLGDRIGRPVREHEDDRCTRCGLVVARLEVEERGVDVFAPKLLGHEG